MAMMTADDVQAALDQRVGPVDAAQDRMRETAAAMQQELEALKKQHARLLEEHRILNEGHQRYHQQAPDYVFLLCCLAWMAK